MEVKKKVEYTIIATCNEYEALINILKVYSSNSELSYDQTLRELMLKKLEQNR